MGEILRAVLDATCIQSNPAWYSAQVTHTSTFSASDTFAQRQVNFQCKADTWFLAMAWTQDVAIGSATPQWDSKTVPTTFIVRDMKSSKVYAGPTPIVHSNAGYSGNNIAPLPHYILFEPATLVGIIMDVQITNDTATVPEQTFLTIAGIEYKMPAGKG